MTSSWLQVVPLEPLLQQWLVGFPLSVLVTSPVMKSVMVALVVVICVSLAGGAGKACFCADLLLAFFSCVGGRSELAVEADEEEDKHPEADGEVEEDDGAGLGVIARLFKRH